jgi:hypothetical protein
MKNNTNLSDREFFSFMSAYESMAETANRLEMLSIKDSEAIRENKNNPKDFTGLMESLQEIAIRFLEKPEYIRNAKNINKLFRASVWNHWKKLKMKEVMDRQDTESFNDIENFLLNETDLSVFGSYITTNELYEEIEKSLKSFEKLVFNDYFFNRLTQKEIGAKHKKTQQYIQQVVRQILDKVQKYMAKDCRNIRHTDKSTTDNRTQNKVNLRYLNPEYSLDFWKRVKDSEDADIRANVAVHIPVTEYSRQSKPKTKAVSVKPSVMPVVKRPKFFNLDIVERPNRIESERIDMLYVEGSQCRYGACQRHGMDSNIVPLSYIGSTGRRYLLNKQMENGKTVLKAKNMPFEVFLAEIVMADSKGKSYNI